MHTLPPMHSPHPPATEVGGYKNLRRVYKARPSWALRPIPNSMWSPFGFSWPGIWSSDTPCHNICPPVGARPDFQWYFGHICRRQQIWYFVQFEKSAFQQCHGPSCVWWSCRLYSPRVDDMNDEGTMIQQDRVLPRKVSAAPGYLLIAPPASS